ncbi:hypothetical protein IF1G_03656 [Cordyceps javanica]|uniref:Uncharacterized protein n=1 Tax=Cordyceps javanica TaxID=43265 RepID=A0A545V875_9HYPO|nr:hypothetical protein IF1G_03656 [Cordyceps javanica]
MADSPCPSVGRVAVFEVARGSPTTALADVAVGNCPLLTVAAAVWVRAGPGCFRAIFSLTARNKPLSAVGMLLCFQGARQLKKRKSSLIDEENLTSRLYGDGARHWSFSCTEKRGDDKGSLFPPTFSRVNNRHPNKQHFELQSTSPTAPLFNLYTDLGTAL